MRSDEQLAVGREAGIRHQERHHVGKYRLDSRRDSHEQRWRCRLVHRRPEYRDRRSATRNDCGCVDCSASVLVGSVSPSIVSPDSLVRQAESRQARAPRSKPSVHERLVVGAASTLPVLCPSSPLRCSAEQLECLGYPEDVADLLFQIAVEVPMNRNLRDEIGRCKIEHVHHDAR